MNETKLVKSRWENLVSDLPDEIGKKWWDKIESEYSNPARKYHNLKHISQVFEHLDDCRSKLINPNSVAFAIFFHDLYYNPKAPDNEEKSSELFQTFAVEAGISVDSPLYKEVSDLILLTKTHLTDEHKEDCAVGTEDKHYFLDFDMSILGSEPDEYNKYAESIRHEYDYLPNATYNGLRAKVLKSFLQIPNIFATEEFRSKYEQKARKNIQQEIKDLEV